jgi:hypothetical protein
MDDQNNKAFTLLNSNADFLESMPVDENIIKETTNGGGGSKDKVPPKVESNGDSHEKIFLSIDNEVIDFFQSTTRRSRKVMEEMDEIRSARSPLIQMSEGSDDAERALAQETTQDYEIDSIKHEVAKLKHRIVAEIEDNHRNFNPDSNTSRGTQDLLEAEQKFIGNGEFEDLMQELKEADSDTNLEKREARINELRIKLLHQISTIDEKANIMAIDNITLRENSKDNITGIRNNLRNIDGAFPYTRSKLGESTFYRVQQRLVEIYDAQGQVVKQMEPLESLPIEFKLISQEAYNLGISVNDLIIDLIENPK